MALVLTITLLVVAICVLLLGIRVFFSKSWSFPNTHVDGNKALTDKGLSCHRHQHREAQRRQNLFDRIEKEARLS